MFMIVYNSAHLLMLDVEGAGKYSMQTFTTCIHTYRVLNNIE